MAMLGLSEILQPSVGNGWGIGAYDTINLATTFGIMDAAEADNAPVILLIYPDMVPSEYYKTYAAFIKEEVNRRNINAALVLDHGASLKEVKAALDAGFSGVMIDASSKQFERNVAITKAVVEMAHSMGITVEAELGHVGAGADVLREEQMQALYTRVEEAQKFVDQTCVDALAVAIGTAHGLYTFEPHLDFERLSAIREQVNIPLVLHGSSGTPEDQIAKAVKLGINKINVYTDIRMAVLKELERLKSLPAEEVDLVDIDRITRAVTKKVVQHKNALFGAVGKGSLYR